jgi:radical SAM superfamily enzyme YgiQ (UPF0313 family)
MKVFLGDLVHSGGTSGIWTMPLNIGYVAEFVAKYLGTDIEFALFKHPEELIEAIETEKPDAIGLSYYVWNTNLNQRIFQIAREKDPSILTIGGGPAFTSQNANMDGALKFFDRQPECDSFVVNQGERGMLALLTRYRDVELDRTALISEPVEGNLVNNLAHNGKCHISAPLEPLRDLDEIPSPYLSGALDKFFSEPIIPIIETNRSCPYRCTFCAWGIGTQKLARFSTERVLAEIDYIATRCKKTANMYIADANFGILERDALFAERMYEHHQKNGYPGHVMVQWNKTRPDRVLKVAQGFREISEIGASMQSLSPTVQEAIKRKNLPLEAVVEMNKALEEQGQGGQLFSELILGLPEETFDSHVDSNKRLIDVGAEVFNYNLHLLPGTEMDTKETREKYFKKTAWRLHDNSFGIYGGKKIFEGQEVVIKTSTMSEEDLRSFRFIHFLLQFMWGRKWYYDYLKLLRDNDIHPVDSVLEIASAFKRDDGEMGDLYKAFRADHELENFESYAELEGYWSTDEGYERLRSGQYGKLNYLYTFKILLEHQSSFNQFLKNIAEKIALRNGFKDIDGFTHKCDDLLRFCENLRISLTEDMNLVQHKRARFGFDILAWRNNTNAAQNKAHQKNVFEYEFFLSQSQQDALSRQLAQFKDKNVNVTLRRMSQDTSADQFFYQVREVKAEYKEEIIV